MRSAAARGWRLRRAAPQRMGAPHQRRGLRATAPRLAKSTRWDRLLGTGQSKAKDMPGGAVPEDAPQELRDAEWDLRVLVAEAKDEIASARMVLALANPYVEEDVNRARRVTAEVREEYDALLSIAPGELREALSAHYGPVLAQLDADCERLEP
eukprot:TRINITY_DN28592_c0_g1_i2.p3 TRINITY_DN28592_c0_g1~~TRINITY_DN28592_c0_g1_i2.p3  ORF type:complete len:179 (+),score=58.37 TRINITY_DN28592_c0_g1_i2:76-537(+)